MYLMHARGNPPQQSWFASFKLLQHAYHRALDDSHFQAIMQVWHQIAIRLLKYYKIEEPARGSEAWMPWIGVFGRLEPEDVRGSMMMVASHATGWSGLAAIHFAPALHKQYFLVFCLFLIFSGLLHDYGVAHRLSSPEQSWRLGIVRSFEELKRTLQKNPTMEEHEQLDTH
jgi:hypothetical protein